MGGGWGRRLGAGVVVEFLDVAGGKVFHALVSNGIVGECGVRGFGCKEQGV